MPSLRFILASFTMCLSCSTRIFFCRRKFNTFNLFVIKDLMILLENLYHIVEFPVFEGAIILVADMIF